MKELILDHVAVAVEDLDKAVNFYESLGLSFSPEREVVEDQGVETAFASIDKNAHLELLSPWGEEGPIHKFLQKKGAGIHHLCFQVDDIEKSMEEMKQKGISFLYPNPKVGANNCLVNFISPKVSGGVLVEISQKGAL